MPIWVPAARLLIRAGIAARLPSIRALLGDGVRFLPHYSGRILASPNVELQATQALLDQRPGDLVDLSLAAPPESEARPLSPVERMEGGYPPLLGWIRLRRRIAQFLDEESRIDADPHREILISNGVSQAVGLALDAFVDPGDRVVLFDPSFFIYRQAAENRRARVVFVSTELDDGRTLFEERELARKLRGAKMLFVNSPANPTGGVLDPESLERIAYWCKRRRVLIFSDEVYGRFQYEGDRLSIGALPAARDLAITAGSFSKSHGLAGARVGWIAAQRYLLGPMTVTALLTAPFVSSRSQELALAALDEPAGEREILLARYRRRRALAAAGLARAGLVAGLPAGAFFFWAPLGSLAESGIEFARRLLETESVRIMPGDAFGPSGRDHVRISFASDARSIENGCRRLAAFVARHEAISIPFPRRGRRAA